MENQLVRRRMKTIGGHFASATDNISGAATQIFPANCSSSLNTVIRRVDNRIHFARQGSTSQACFMRQASTEQVNPAQSGGLLKSTGSMNEGSSNTWEAPLFSRPARMQPKFPSAGVIQPALHDCKLLSTDPPKFSRPNRRISGQSQFHYGKNIRAFESSGLQWSPRMDVAESGCNYILTVELPGVSISDIRVEVRDQSLTVMGKNSAQWWKGASSNGGVSKYHKREISHGPYQVAWPLPNNVNMDAIYAEFVDGLLRITIPKL